MQVLTLLRHAENDGDVLTAGGVIAAVKWGRAHDDVYDVAITSGAHRTAQTLANALVGGLTVRHEVRSDLGLLTPDPQTVSAAVAQLSTRTTAELAQSEPELARALGRQCANVLRRVLASAASEAHVIIVGHSPMLELGYVDLTREHLPLLAKCQSVELRM